MGQDCSDCARLQVERASALKATHDLERVLLREGDVEGAYERRLAEAVRERDEAKRVAEEWKQEAEAKQADYAEWFRLANDERKETNRLRAEVEREKASATRGWQTADELHLTVRDLKAEVARLSKLEQSLPASLRDAHVEVERLQRELTDSEVAREALRKQRDEARASDAESLRLYRNVRERLDKMQEERDFAVSALRQSKSPAESCAEERAAGNGGCGACALCCKELRDEVDKLRLRLPKVAQKQQEKDVEEMTDALNDLRRILPYGEVGIYKVIMAIRQRVLSVQYVTDTGEA